MPGNTVGYCTPKRDTVPSLSIDDGEHDEHRAWGGSQPSRSSPRSADIRSSSVGSTNLAGSSKTTSTARRSGASRYIAALRAVVEAFSDYQWELQRLLVDGQWLAARLYGPGSHNGPFRGIAATGRAIRTQELVIYRTVDSKMLNAGVTSAHPYATSCSSCSGVFQSSS
jgi:predicted ester cyclase